jgi:hypothetical protein
MQSGYANEPEQVGRDGCRRQKWSAYLRAGNLISCPGNKQSGGRGGVCASRLPGKAGPAAHFDRNERYAYFGDRTLTKLFCGEDHAFHSVLH